MILHPEPMQDSAKRRSVEDLRSELEDCRHPALSGCILS